MLHPDNGMVEDNDKDRETCGEAGVFCVRDVK